MATERRPVNVAEYAERARELLPQMVYDYYAGGAEDERTIADNRAGTRAVGYYDDELVHTARGWQIARRRFTMVLVQPEVALPLQEA